MATLISTSPISLERVLLDLAGVLSLKPQLSPVCNTGAEKRVVRKIPTALCPRLVYEASVRTRERLRIGLGPERKEEWMNSIRLTIPSSTFALMRFRVSASPYLG